MASTADSTNIYQEWKENLKELILPEFDPKSIKEEYLGSGVYGDTTILSHNGVSYAAKKINISVFSKDEFRKKFAAGCLQLSQLRHPYVAQFLGVQITDSFTSPVLFTELYPLSLTTCFQRYPEIPIYSKYLILLEVSLGLEYLHQLPVPVVHGHLCPNNILLTEGLHVKIADSIRFGLETSTPSNSPYQPPEEGQVEAGDVFCLGDVILHIILQKEVSPLEYKHHRNPENVNEPFILTEVNRREGFLKEVEETHQLKSLILRCLEEEPEKRPTAHEMSEKLSACVKQYKPEYQNILDMFMALGQLSLMKDTVSGMNETLEAKDNEIEALKLQMEPFKLEIQSKEDVMAFQKEEMDSYKHALQSKEGRVKAHETGIRAKEALIKAKDREIAAKKQVITTKESLLRSANKRIEVLEKHVRASRKKKNTGPPPLPELPSEPKYRESSSMQSSPESIKSDGGLKPSKPYRGLSSSPHSGETFKLQRANSIGQASNKTDPKLAKILARQHQKLEDSDCFHEKKPADNIDQPERPPVVWRRSRTMDSTTPELRKILEKRKSFVEDN